MTDEQKELLFDLLVKKATCGLDEAEQSQLAAFDPAIVDAEFRSLELTAAAISMASLDVEPMPEHLSSQILASYTDHAKVAEIEPARIFTADDVFAKPRASVLSWLGWVAAAIAVAALVFNIYTTRKPSEPEQARTTPVETPRPLTPAEQREELLRTAPDVISASWAPGNVKDMQVAGDVVWSDAKQQGFMRFRNLPANDPSTTCYQLWIFDQTQDKATPIDGGIFDNNGSGEIVVPIQAKLTAVKPGMFAVTIERHGGVVVSKREKIAALAKVETHST